MKTTLEIDETVMRELKARAAREGRSMSELVETALRMLLGERPRQVALPPLPVFHLGGLSDHVDSRDRLDAFLGDDDLDEQHLPAPSKKGGR
jgi:hypothetical protein